MKPYRIIGQIVLCFLMFVLSIETGHIIIKLSGIVLSKTENKLWTVNCVYCDAACLNNTGAQYTCYSLKVCDSG
jgi:hypothetical protein